MCLSCSYPNSYLCYNLDKHLIMQILESGYITTINLKTVETLAETFRRNPEVHIQWLVECSRSSEQGKNLFSLIMLQASLIHNEGIYIVDLWLYGACNIDLIFLHCLSRRYTNHCTHTCFACACSC